MHKKDPAVHGDSKKYACGHSSGGSRALNPLHTLCDTFHIPIPGESFVPRAQWPLTLLDGGGQAQFASFDLLYGHLQPRGQKLRYLQVQHELLCIAAKKAHCKAKRSMGPGYTSRRTSGTSGCGGWEGVTADMGAGRLSARSLPPLPAQEADLVGHHALLELVLRGD